MKKIIKKILQRHNLYYHLKYSALFSLYQSIFKPDVIAAEKKEIAFYRSFLPQAGLVFDIGAYDGHKTAAFLHISKKVVCVEPDAGSFHILKIRFRKKPERVFLENKAVSSAAGKSTMFIHHPASAFNTLSEDWKNILEKDNLEKWSEKISFAGKVTVETTTLDLMIKKYGVPDFIKIDVEGLEEKVLQGLTQRIAFLSFEAMLPEGLAAINSCLNLIRKLDPGTVFNIAAFERLLFAEFISHSKLEKWLGEQHLTHFEVIVKMHTQPTGPIS